jgi:hypothetical protein
MSKQLKDYLHLYLQVFDRILLIEKSNYYFVHNLFIHKGGTRVLDARILTELLTHGDGLEYKLLLRPLPDMTEEEKTELYYLDDHALHELGDGTGYALPYVFTWCLSKGFDLFGLIESGLAIDKTKNK